MYGSWSNKWCANYGIAWYDSRWAIGWSGSASEQSAYWQAEPKAYTYLNVQEPSDFLETNIPVGIMILSAIPAENCECHN